MGTRKVRTLLECGARVTVISPEATPELAALAGQGRIQWHTRDYRASDLDNTFLVIGATDDQRLNHKIHHDAEMAQRLCNIADQPDLCNFILPAVMRRGNLMITVSTGGKSPAFAKHLRQQLEKQYGPEYDTLLQLMGAIRKQLLAEAHAPEAHKPLFEKLIGGGLLEMIRSNDPKNINGLLTRVLGPGFDYQALMQTQ